VKIYFVEPRIMENVEAALVHDGWTVALGRSERSGPHRSAPDYYSLVSAV
jgi:hypothetical protein